MTVRDALAGKHGEYEIVLANPPFGKTSRVTIVNAAGEQQQAGRVSNHGRCSRAMIINHMASCSWPRSDLSPWRPVAR